MTVRKHAIRVSCNCKVDVSHDEATFGGRRSFKLKKPKDGRIELRQRPSKRRIHAGERRRGGLMLVGSRRHLQKPIIQYDAVLNARTCFEKLIEQSQLQIGVFICLDSKVLQAALLNALEFALRGRRGRRRRLRSAGGGRGGGR